MIPVNCPICKTESNYSILYEANFHEDSFNADVFSARRLPDKCHYRLVKCKTCGVSYSNPILENEKLTLLYKKSKFNYSSEIENLKKSYGYYIKKTGKNKIKEASFLEIGCGSGFMLEEAINLGFENVYGVEPSQDASSKANTLVRDKIIVDVFKENLFPDKYFDIICFFQVLDHISDPSNFISLCKNILKDDGVILCITHNIDSIQAKILRESSPIVDIEHTCLFNKKTLKKIFEKEYLKVDSVFGIYNIYKLEYWINMMPFNKKVKEKCKHLFLKCGLLNKNIKIKAGNIGIIARK